MLIWNKRNNHIKYIVWVIRFLVINITNTISVGVNTRHRLLWVYASFKIMNVDIASSKPPHIYNLFLEKMCFFSNQIILQLVDLYSIVICKCFIHNTEMFFFIWLLLVCGFIKPLLKLFYVLLFFKRNKFASFITISSGV